jgi:hypothetical protein
MEMTDEDSRQEWTTQTYSCHTCNHQVTRRIEFDQLGMVISDELEEI